MRYLVNAGFSCATLIAAAALGPVANSQTVKGWDTVGQAAKQEGKVVVYSGLVGAPETRSVIKLFEAQYNIKVDLLEARASELQERIRTEVTTGKTSADVFLTGETTNDVVQKAGLLQDFGDLPNFGKLKIKPAAVQQVPVFTLTYAILINTKLVLPDQEPKSWADLTDPRWKGKILSDQIGNPGGIATWFFVMQKTFGQEYHERMAKQEITFSNQVRENYNRVLRGEFAVYLPFWTPDIGRYEGMPVKAIVPKEGLPYTVMSAAVVKGASNPNAARLFINSYLGADAQLVYASAGLPPAVGGLENQTPEKMRWAANAILMGRQDLEGQEERMEFARKTYLGK